MGQRGQLDKLPVAHTGSVTAMDWSYLGAGNSGVKVGEGNTSTPGSEGHGWLVTGGLDSVVKVRIPASICIFAKLTFFSGLGPDLLRADVA